MFFNDKKMNKEHKNNTDKHAGQKGAVENNKKAEEITVKGAEDKLITVPMEEYRILKEDAGKLKEFQDKFLRLQADFDNSRKRIEKQAQDFVKYANEGIILELLVVLDDLERTLSASQNNKTEVLLKGVEMILAHLYEMLKEHGVRPIEVTGKAFDPHTSEALLQVESDSPEATVVEELQKGYFFNDRVIRTAKVAIAKAQNDNQVDKSAETQKE